MADEKHGQARRRLLKSLAAGGAVTAAHVVPNRWVKPVVEQVVVPAYAQGSGRMMTAFLSVSFNHVRVDPPGATVDGILGDSSDAIQIDGQATLSPASPSQLVTLSFAFNAGGGNSSFTAAPPLTGLSNPGTGVADFDTKFIGLNNSGNNSDAKNATLVGTFSAVGVPPVVITVKFA